MTIVITVAAGIASALLGMLFARAAKVERQMYPGLLLLLPFFYAIFALRAGEGGVSLIELAIGIPWIAVGLTCLLLNVRWSTQILGVLWILHAVFDLSHGLLPDNPGLPNWYPLWCAAVDAVVGIYLLMASTQAVRAATESRLDA